jgi:histone acetyltransferase (RNA polymerase elongator complex component)
MKAILETARPYLDNGMFTKIRISTRPDAIDEAHLELLKTFGVQIIELGVQSMDDKVLLESGRGHTSRDTVNASKLIRKHGFQIGMQLMPGLPGDSGKTFHHTVSEVIRLHPDMVRIYPAIVLKNTKLARRYHEGQYHPLDLQTAVDICAETCARFEDENIRVVRIGLMDTPTLATTGQIVAGPWHSAFGQLVKTRVYLLKIQSQLPPYGRAKQIQLRVPETEMGLLRGHKNEGLKWIEKKTGAKITRVDADSTLPMGEIRSTMNVF